ncbi:MAG TPA: glycosyltransferase family 4 protein [Candidatus Deferrimicrobiaceae bacterium]
MDIAIVTQSLRAVGGTENVVVWLAGGLAGKGHAVTVFTGEFSESVWGKDADRPYAVHVLGGEGKKASSTWLANREAGKALGTALSARAFDVVNAHNYPASLWVHYAKAGAPKFPPTVLFLHNLPGYFYEEVTAPHIRRLPGLRNAWNRLRPKRILRKLRQRLLGYRELDQASVRSFDKVIANSLYSAGLARRIYSRGVEPCVLGVRWEESSGTSGRSGEGRNAPEAGVPPVVLTVARIEFQKNFDTLLEAIRILKTGRAASGKGFRYVVAGGGPHLEQYRAMCHRLRIDDVVTFLGSVPHDRVRDLYKEASFLVHVPLDEPFGLVPLEAALCGKASVVSDHGGPAEVVVDGVTGVHVDALDPAAIAGRIGHLMDHPDVARRMGEAACSRVGSEYSWARFVDAFERHLVRSASAP